MEPKEIFHGEVFDLLFTIFFKCFEINKPPCSEICFSTEIGSENSYPRKEQTKTEIKLKKKRGENITIGELFLENRRITEHF